MIADCRLLRLLSSGIGDLGFGIRSLPVLVLGGLATLGAHKGCPYLGRDGPDARAIFRLLTSDFWLLLLSLTWAFGPPMEMKIGSARGCIMNPAWNGEGRLRSGYVETVSELDPECAF